MMGTLGCVLEISQPLPARVNQEAHCVATETPGRGEGSLRGRSKTLSCAWGPESTGGDHRSLGPCSQVLHQVRE